MERLKNLSLKNKFFFGSTAVIVLVSLLIALFTRWVVLSSLTGQLEQRGVGIAQSIAESSRGYMLTENYPELTSLLFDARLGERRQLVLYAFILDKQGGVLAHTFIDEFPPKLVNANPIAEKASQSIKLLRLRGNSAYDVAVPVIEGIYQIGTMHVGLDQKHIDQLVGKLRAMFIGFISMVIVIFFGISHWLSKTITRPIFELTTVSDELSRGNFDVSPLAHSATAGRKDEVHLLTESFVNMTERIKESQARLRESEEKYRSLFAGGPNPIFVVDRHTFEILDANPIAEKTYGYKKDALIGRPFTDLGPLDIAAVDRNIDKEEWRGSRQVSAKVQFVRKYQKPFYVNVHASPARYQGRDAVILATTDITEMVEKDSQLIQASKLTTLGEMSAGIAHELNQPLNAIKMGSEFLKMMIEDRRRLPEEDLCRVVTEISEQVDRAAGIITRIRDFGRKSDFTMEKVWINNPVRTVRDIVGKQLRLQNIRLEIDLDETIPPILAHHNRLEQVVFNLVTNGRDAIIQKQEFEPDANRRTIRIRTFHRDLVVFLEVADTGLGIPDEFKERIFEAFFTTKQMGEGMGLGLSITSSIVGDYQGEINVQSEKGKGAVFTLTFPAAQTAKTARIWAG